MAGDFDEESKKYKCCCCHSQSAAKCAVITEIILMVAVCIAFLALFLVWKDEYGEIIKYLLAALLIGAAADAIVLILFAVLVLIGLRRQSSPWLIPYLIVKGVQMFVGVVACLTCAVIAIGVEIGAIQPPPKEKLEEKTLEAVSQMKSSTSGDGANSNSNNFTSQLPPLLTTTMAGTEQAKSAIRYLYDHIVVIGITGAVTLFVYTILVTYFFCAALRCYRYLRDKKKAQQAGGNYAMQQQPMLQK